MKLRYLLSCIVGIVVFSVSYGIAGTLRVGPNGEFRTICSAIEAARSGDTVEIDRADYVGDVCAWHTDGLTLRGVNGLPHIMAGGRAAESRAIWVIYGSNTIIENVELSDCKVATHNGAGIFLKGSNLNIISSYIHDNEDGLHAIFSPDSSVMIDSSEFARNGFVDGHSHNIYIEYIAKFVIRDSYSHDAIGGHLIKSRAQENHIERNWLTNDQASSSSYELDLPNGGLSYVVDNYMKKSARERNTTLVSYGSEGLKYESDQLYFIRNILISDKPAGTFLSIAAAVKTPATVIQNFFVGEGVTVTQSRAIMLGNVTGTRRDLALLDAVFSAPPNVLGSDLSPAANQHYIEALRIVLEYATNGRDFRDVYRTIPTEFVEVGSLFSVCLVTSSLLAFFTRSRNRWKKFSLALWVLFISSVSSYLMAFVSLGNARVWMFGIPVVLAVLILERRWNWARNGWFPGIWISQLIAYLWGYVVYFGLFWWIIWLFVINLVMVWLAGRLFKSAPSDSSQL